MDWIKLLNVFSIYANVVILFAYIIIVQRFFINIFVENKNTETNNKNNNKQFLSIRNVSRLLDDNTL